MIVQLQHVPSSPTKTVVAVTPVCCQKLLHNMSPVVYLFYTLISTCVCNILSNQWPIWLGCMKVQYTILYRIRLVTSWFMRYEIICERSFRPRPGCRQARRASNKICSYLVGRTYFRYDRKLELRFRSPAFTLPAKKNGLRLQSNGTPQPSKPKRAGCRLL